MNDPAVQSAHGSRAAAAIRDTSAAMERALQVSLTDLSTARPLAAVPAFAAIADGAPAPSAAGAFAEFLRRRRFGSLDGLRACGVLAVIWHHTIAHGVGGVSLFFALSGFLIATSLIRARDRGEFSVRPFYERTARRILPLYFAVLAIYLVMVALLERDGVARAQFFANLPAFATFTANWFVDLNHPRVIFYFVWSLSAQVQFYLLWPWIERGGSRRFAVAVAASLLVMAQGIAAWAGADAREVIWLRVLSGMPVGIMAGVLLAHALHTPRIFFRLFRLWGRRGSGLGTLAVVVALALAPGLGGVWHETLAACTHAALIGACVIREDHDLARLLRARTIAQAGTVSYGIYLLHMLAVNVVRRGEAWWDFRSVYLEFALGAVVALGLATASHRWWEARFLPERAEGAALTASLRAPRAVPRR